MRPPPPPPPPPPWGFFFFFLLWPAWATVEGGSGGPGGRAGGVGEEGNEEPEVGAEAWMAAALGLGLGNGGAKDAGLERKGEPVVAVGGRKRRPEQCGCGGVMPSRVGTAPGAGGMAGVWLGFWGQLPVKCQALPGEIFLCHDEGGWCGGPVCV